MKQATNNLFYIDMIGCAHVRIRNICLKPYYYTIQLSVQEAPDVRLPREFTIRKQIVRIQLRSNVQLNTGISDTEYREDVHPSLRNQLLLSSVCFKYLLKFLV